MLFAEISEKVARYSQSPVMIVQRKEILLPKEALVSAIKRDEEVIIPDGNTQLDQSLHTILQVISITLFEKVPIYQMINESRYRSKFANEHIQLNLFGS